MKVLGAGAGSEGMALILDTDMEVEDTVTVMVVVDSLEEMEEVGEEMEEAVSPLFHRKPGAFFSINF